MLKKIPVKQNSFRPSESIHDSWYLWVSHPVALSLSENQELPWRFWSLLVSKLFLFSRTFLKIVIDFFFFFGLRHMACRISVPRPGIESTPPAVEAQSLNSLRVPGTTREVPEIVIDFFFGAVSGLQKNSAESIESSHKEYIFQIETHWQIIVPCLFF